MQYTGLSLISLYSLDDVDNVSEPTILSSSSFSETEDEISSRSGVPFSMPDKILLAICALHMPLSRLHQNSNAHKHRKGSERN